MRRPRRRPSFKPRRRKVPGLLLYGVVVLGLWILSAPHQAEISRWLGAWIG